MWTASAGEKLSRAPPLESTENWLLLSVHSFICTTHRSPHLTRPFASLSLCLCLYLQNQDNKPLSYLLHKTWHNTKHHRNVRYKSDSMILWSHWGGLMTNMVALAPISISCLLNTSGRLGDQNDSGSRNRGPEEGTGVQNKGKWPGEQKGDRSLLSQLQVHILCHTFHCK